MRIDLYDEAGRRVAKVHADLKSPPAAVPTPNSTGQVQERYLDWNQALDDEGRLRKCPACNCEELYVRRAFPPITGFIVVLVIGILCFALYGLEFVDPVPLFITAGLLVTANIVFTLLSTKYLTCYRCTSRYHEAGISRDREAWDTATAAKYKKVENPDSLFMWSMIILGGLIALTFALLAYFY